MGNFTAAVLPDSEKEQLCRSLLEEFGVRNIRANPRSGELVHGCIVSAYHRDQERNPTASLNYQKLTFNCLGCGSHGGLLWFIATVRGCSTQEAYRWLEQSAGIGADVMDTERLLSIIQAFYSPATLATDIIPTYSDRVIEEWAQYIHPYMTTGAEDLGIPGRHIPEDNLRRLRVGWDPEADRIIIPHFWKGKLVGWQGRRIWASQGEKYRSTPDFPKDQTIYNVDPSRRYRRLLVVESPMTVVSKIHLLPHEDDGFGGTFGSEITDRQVRLMAKADHVILWVDNDEAGWKSMVGSKNIPGLTERLSPYTRVSVVDNPYDADGADVSDDDFCRLVEERAVPYVLWKPRRGALLDYTRGGA